MAHLTVNIQDNTIYIRSQAFCAQFPDTDENQKALFVFLRSLSCPETGKALFTNQQVADAFGKKDRRDIDNFVRIFRNRGGNFLPYLARKNTKQEGSLPEIERQILESPLLSMAEQYRIFCEAHPQERVCEQTFRRYVNVIPVTKLLKRVRHLGFSKDQSFDGRRYLDDLLALERLSRAKKKEIVEIFPQAEEATQQKAARQALEVSSPVVQKKLLVVLLYVCNVSQEMLALLFGVGKTSIHNYIYEVCSEELDWQILRCIVCWSGEISFDEKWLWIDGSWQFALCAVDSVTGFPLLIALYPTLDSVNWTLFFKRFKALYGLPKLITSDGSQPLANAREVVFPGVRYQLCKFHKLKNLMKQLRQHIHNPQLFTRCVRLAKHIFSNTSVSSRKYAAKTLCKLAGSQVSSYVHGHFLTCWRKLTMALTNNAAERFNRKIEKCFFGRYGIPSSESAEVLLRGLWLKELLLNGHKHRDATAELTTIDVSRICQESLDTSKILHFFHDNGLSQIEKLA